MREYLNEIKDTGNYLVKILEVLSMLSNEYHFPVDKMYLGEKNLFNKVQIYISNNLINKDTFFPKILEKKYEDVNNLYRKRIIELKQNRKLDDSVSQIIDAELIDIYKNTINEYVDIYYQEIKKYIKIEKKGLFVLDSNYRYFRNTLQDCGNKEQKKELDDCIYEIKHIIFDIDSTVIELSKPNTLSKKDVNELMRNIDHRILLFKEHVELKQKFDALKNIKNDDGDFFIKDNEKIKIFVWSDTWVVLASIIMNLKDIQTAKASFWKPFEMAFDHKLWDTAKQHINKQGTDNYINNETKAKRIINRIKMYKE